jgi:hypothetical protein
MVEPTAFNEPTRKGNNMLIKIMRTMSVLTLVLVLAPACAQQDNEADAKASAKPVADSPAPASAGETAHSTGAAGSDMSIMDKPVNFSTPEDVEKSIETVRQQAGDKAARDLNNALKYILFYDLSVGHDKEKMYAKYNGKTPNEIIVEMKR